MNRIDEIIYKETQKAAYEEQCEQGFVHQEQPNEEMNKYIGKIERYFGEYGTFEIKASNKEEAKRKILKKANIYDNYILSTLKIKKIQKFKN